MPPRLNKKLRDAIDDFELAVEDAVIWKMVSLKDLRALCATFEDKREAKNRLIMLIKNYAKRRT